jgi:hypothetical protein
MQFIFRNCLNFTKIFYYFSFLSIFSIYIRYIEMVTRNYFLSDNFIYFLHSLMKKAVMERLQTY